MAFNYDDDAIAVCLKEYIEVLPEIREALDTPPKRVGLDNLPYVFFLPGREIFTEKSADGLWLISCDWRSLLVATSPNQEEDYESAREAMRLRSLVRRKWMATSRLELPGGGAFDIRVTGDGGIIPRRVQIGPNQVAIQYAVEFILRVSFQELVPNTGR